MHQDEAGAKLRALFRSEEMSQVASYAERGRRFEKVDASELEQLWAAAFRAFAVKLDMTKSLDLDDLGAELMLRQIDLPEHLVRDEMAQVSERARREGLTEDAKDELWRRMQALDAASRKPQG